MVVALTDVEIAVSAVSAGATVWTHDSDFERIRRVTPQLQLYEPA
jgi:predicted nucleic acid-binding protein